MKNKLCWIYFFLMVLFLGIQPVYTQDNENVTWVKDNDRICFIGNSITHGGDYCFFINLYYHTRYPELHYQTFNCGISGNTAQDLLDRMNSDILVHQPTISTLMIGMNDVNRDLYSVNCKKSDIPALKEQAISTYKQNVQKVAEILLNNNSKIIFLTPSIYDQTAFLPTENLFGVNDALANCGNFIKELALKYKSPVVDFNTRMNEINLREQKKDSTFTIVGNDRVHPELFGHLIMAHSFLTTLKASAIVSSMKIDKKEKTIIDQTNCTITDLHITETKIKFNCIENSLPYPIMKKADLALELVSFNKDLNNELLFYKNLELGNYRLIIDKDTISTFSSTELEQGINLANFSITAQYKQAYKAMEIAWKSHRLNSDKIRIMAMVETSVLKTMTRPIDLKQARILLDNQLERIKNESYYGWIKDRYDEYIEFKKNEKETIKQINSLQKEYYKQLQPIKHVYILQKVKVYS